MPPLPTVPPLRTVIADADPLARRLIASVLRDAAIAVVAEARSTAEAVELVLDHQPDVALLGLDGVQATRAIHRQRPAQRIVVLAREEDVRTALLALRAGACGFLSKEVDLDALPRVLAGVVNGEAAVSRRVERSLIEDFRSRPHGLYGLRPVKGPLTTREWEVVDLLAPGRTTDDIADSLVISHETVRSHVKNIMRKLEVSSRGDARAAAEQLRLAA
jgi:two-component system, NarL family, response regulator LiaR